jgi:hypothetical protein
MHPRLRTTGILALLSMVAAAVFCILMRYDPAIVVLSQIIVIGFFTVIFVGVIGSLENEAHPQNASDSAAVNAWKARLGDVPEAVESGETGS